MPSSSPAAAAAALAVLISLTACGAAEAQDPVDPAGDETSEQDPVSVDEDCLLGRWSLDTEDYRGQAEAYLKSLAIPLESLEVAGTQTLTFEAGGEEDNVGLATDLTWSGSLLGQGFVVEDASAGSGAWEPSGIAPNQLVIDTWIWGLEPHVAPGDAPSIPALGLADNGPVDVTCTATTLELHGTDAILTGRFTRID
jgi:hypothetical protein